MSDTLKQQAAEAALTYIEDDMVVGIGTGTTVNYFIEALATMAHRIEGVVASSEQSALRLKQYKLPLMALNAVNTLSIYVDGVDEINNQLQMVKGGGGALTGEKVVASVTQKFVAIAHEAKFVSVLGQFPVAVEVLPMARSAVARALVGFGGNPVYREGFTTDHGNIILDVFQLDLTDPITMEQKLNQIPGVVCHGIFASQPADICLLARETGLQTLSR